MKRTPLRPSGKGLERRTRLKSSAPPRATGRPSKRFAKRRDPAYKAWICTLGCQLTNTRPVDPAHVKSRGASGDDRRNLVPLNHRLHDEFHRIGRRSFEAKYGIDLVLEAERLDGLYESLLAVRAPVRSGTQTRGPVDG